MIFLSTAAALLTVIIETPIVMLLTLDKWRDDIEIFPYWLVYIALTNIATNVTLNTTLQLFSQSLTEFTNIAINTIVILVVLEACVCAVEAFIYSRFWKMKTYEFIVCSLFANVISVCIGLFIF